MALKDFLNTKKEQFSNWALSWASEDAVRVAGYKRGHSQQGSSVSKTIEHEDSAPDHSTIEDWKGSLSMAYDTEDPRRHLLQRQYFNSLFDLTLASVVETRQLSAVRVKWKIILDEKNRPDLMNLLNAPWFFEIRKKYMTEFSHGTGLLEFFSFNEDGSIKEIKEIPRSNFCPHRKLIFKSVDDEKGVPYDNERLRPYVVQFGEDSNLGILAKAVPLTIAKKFTFGAWKFTQKRYGVPPIIIRSARNDDSYRQELLNTVMNIIRGGGGVVSKNDEIEAQELIKTDPYRVFDMFIQRISSEQAKLVLGTDTVNNQDSQGTYGSMAVLNRVSESRTWADVQAMEYWLNDEILPRLIEISPYYAPLKGARIVPDWKEDLSPKDLGNLIGTLSNTWEMDPEELSAMLGFTLIGQRQQNYQQPDPKEDETGQDPNNPKEPQQEPPGGGSGKK